MTENERRRLFDEITKHGRKWLRRQCGKSQWKRIKRVGAYVKRKARFLWDVHDSRAARARHLWNSRLGKSRGRSFNASI